MGLWNSPWVMIMFGNVVMARKTRWNSNRDLIKYWGALGRAHYMNEMHMCFTWVYHQYKFEFKFIAKNNILRQNIILKTIFQTFQKNVKCSTSPIHILLVIPSYDLIRLATSSVLCPLKLSCLKILMNRSACCLKTGLKRRGRAVFQKGLLLFG